MVQYCAESGCKGHYGPDLNCAAARPAIELKIGQVWDWGIGGHEIIALGPQHVVAVCQPYPAVVFSRSYWSRIAHNRLLRPKHELWVNVMREPNDNLFARCAADRLTADFKAHTSKGNFRIACLKIEFEEGEGL